MALKSAQMQIKDYLRILISLLAGFLCAVPAGYQALLPVLLNEGLFSGLCRNNNSTCDKQILRLDLMFNISISMMNMSTCLWGILSWKYGPKPGIILGGSIMTLSSFMFAFGWDWPCFIAYIGFGFSAMGVVFGILVVPPQYPAISGLLFSLLIGSFDASSGIFYIFETLYFNANISMKALFLILAMLVAIISILVHCFVFSNKFFGDQIDKTEDGKSDDIKQHKLHQTTDSNSSSDKLNEMKTNEIELVEISTNDDKESNIIDEIKDMTNLDFSSSPLSDTMKSKVFVFIMIWQMFYVLTKYFYMTTLEKQLAWITNDNEHLVDQGQQIFSIMLLSSGLFSIVTGPIFDHDKTGIKFALLLSGFISFLMAISSVIKIYQVQYITMLGMVFNRFFCFATAPLLIEKIWGQQKQLFIYGIILLFAANFNFTGYLLDYIVTDVLNGSYLMVNLCLGVCCLLIVFVLVAELKKYSNIK